MAISVSIKKKYEDVDKVVYQYGELDNEVGEFSVDKATYSVEQIIPTGASTDKIMYLSSASKIVKLVKGGKALPDVTSYNS